MRLRLLLPLLVLPFAPVLFAGDPPPAAPASEDCAKRCQEMAAARQKMADEHKAMMDKMDAAWKEFRSELDAAHKAKGTRKVDALEMALDKLASFHEMMRDQMTKGPMPAHEGMMGHECCGSMGKMRAMMPDCPMHENKTPPPPRNP